jgi:hypothetical protein
LQAGQLCVLPARILQQFPSAAQGNVANSHAHQLADFDRLMFERFRKSDTGLQIFQGIRRMAFPEFRESSNGKRHGSPFDWCQVRQQQQKTLAVIQIEAGVGILQDGPGV